MRSFDLVAVTGLSGTAVYEALETLAAWRRGRRPGRRVRRDRRPMSWLWVAVAIRQSKRRRQRRRRQAARVTYLPDPWEVNARFPYGQIPPPPSPRKSRKR